MRIGVVRFAAWAPGLESEAAWRAWARSPAPIRGDGAPDARFLPALQRRRCDPLARMVLHVAHECCPAELRSEIACVFASRHGSFGTTVSLLEDLARDAALSPARFSHSVHNAPAGLFSIWAENRTASVSLAAGEGSFAHGLVEAILALHRARPRPVLLVHSDEALPGAVAPLADRSEGSFALALLLAGDGAGGALRFRYEPEAREPEAREPGAREPEAREPGARAAGPAAPRSGGLEFLRWWLCGERELWLPHSGGAFSLCRADAPA